MSLSKFMHNTAYCDHTPTLFPVTNYSNSFENRNKVTHSKLQFPKHFLFDFLCSECCCMSEWQVCVYVWQGIRICINMCECHNQMSEFPIDLIVYSVCVCWGVCMEEHQRRISISVPEFTHATLHFKYMFLCECTCVGRWIR